MPRLRISDTEYYFLRKRGDGNRLYFMLSPYSCLSPTSLYLDKVQRRIEIFLRNKALYKGIADLSRIKEELERIGELNPVEIATILSVLYNEPETRRYVTGRLSPVDKVIFSWAYESSEEVKRMIEEAMNSMDYDRLLAILKDVWEKLPENLKKEMSKKYRINKEREEVLKGPWPEYTPPPWLKKRKKEEEAIAYA
jgi:hypothetical protein